MYVLSRVCMWRIQIFIATIIVVHLGLPPWVRRPLLVADNTRTPLMKRVVLQRESFVVGFEVGLRQGYQLKKGVMMHFMCLLSCGFEVKL